MGPREAAGAGNTPLTTVRLDDLNENVDLGAGVQMGLDHRLKRLLHRQCDFERLAVTNPPLSSCRRAERCQAEQTEPSENEQAGGDAEG